MIDHRFRHVLVTEDDTLLGVVRNAMSSRCNGSDSAS